MRPVQIVLDVCNKNPNATRQQILDLCEEAGAKRTTASTIYAKWKREHSHQLSIEVNDAITYAVCSSASQAIGENNDCAVKATSIVTQIPYAKAHAMIAENGRKKGAGTYAHQYFKVIEKLGFKTELINVDAKTLRTVELELSRRFPGQKALVFTRGHVSAFNGRTIDDWAKDLKKRVKSVYLIK